MILAQCISRGMLLLKSMKKTYCLNGEKIVVRRDGRRKDDEQVLVI